MWETRMNASGNADIRSAKKSRIDTFRAAAISPGAETCKNPLGHREYPTDAMRLVYLRDPLGNKVYITFGQSK